MIPKLVERIGFSLVIAALSAVLIAAFVHDTPSTILLDWVIGIGLALYISAAIMKNEEKP